MLPHNPDSLSDTCRLRFLNTPKKFLPIFTEVSILFFPHTSPYVLKLTRRLLRPLTTRAFSHITSRHATPSLPPSTANVFWHTTLPLPSTAHVFLNPFLTHLHSHLFLTSNAASNGSTRVASASYINIRTTNHDGRAPTYNIYIPFPNTH